MSYAQGTTHYNFPQIVATDRPTFTDANEAFRTLDTKLYALEGSATDVDSRLDTAEGNIVQLQGDVQTAQGTADLAKSTADTAVEQIGITNTNVSQLTTRVGNKFDSVGIADPYDTTATYAVGDVVTYNGQRYRCTTAVTVAEPFDVTKWTGEDVETVLEEIKSDLADLDTYVNKHEVGTSVAITEGQYYTPSDDGYMVVNLPYTSSVTNKRAVIRIKNGSNVVTIAVELPDTGSSRTISAFIRKGCDVTFATDGGYTGVTGNFYPLN